MQDWVQRMGMGHILGCSYPWLRRGLMHRGWTLFALAAALPTASMLYLSCAEMGTMGAPSAMVPCSVSAAARQAVGV